MWVEKFGMHPNNTEKTRKRGWKLTYPKEEINIYVDIDKFAPSRNLMVFNVQKDDWIIKNLREREKSSWRKVFRKNMYFFNNEIRYKNSIYTLNF